MQLVDVAGSAAEEALEEARREEQAGVRSPIVAWANVRKIAWFFLPPAMPEASPPQHGPLGIDVALVGELALITGLIVLGCTTLVL